MPLLVFFAAMVVIDPVSSGTAIPKLSRKSAPLLLDVDQP
jgi:hypothetical protein